jgi:hypothetical protein
LSLQLNDFVILNLVRDKIYFFLSIKRNLIIILPLELRKHLTDSRGFVCLFMFISIIKRPTYHLSFFFLSLGSKGILIIL